MYLEVEDNANCEESVFIRFREQGVPRRVKRVRLYDRRTVGEWCWITGLQADVPTGICPAWSIPAVRPTRSRWKIPEPAWYGLSGAASGVSD